MRAVHRLKGRNRATPLAGLMQDAAEAIQSSGPGILIVRQSRLEVADSVPETEDAFPVAVISQREIEEGPTVEKWAAIEEQLQKMRQGGLLP